jgi:hypothetical protein
MKANTMTNVVKRSPFLVPNRRERLYQNLTKAGCCTSTSTSLNCVKHPTLSLYTLTLAEVTGLQYHLLSSSVNEECVGTEAI